MDLQKWTGHPLAPFQKRLARACAPGRSLITAITIARGNAKSFLMALLAADELTERGGDIILMASSFRQAQVVFGDVIDALHFRFGKEGVRARFVIANNVNSCRILDKDTGGDLQAIAADPRRALGLRPKLLVADEPSAWGPSGERLYVALATSLGKHGDKGSRMIIAGTRPASSGHFFARLLDKDDPDISVHRFAADPDPDKRFHWRNLERANPGLKYGFPARRQLEFERREAKKDPLALQSYLSMRLNLGVSETGDVKYLIDVQTWKAVREREVAPAQGPRVWGVDLGASRSLSSVACFWPATGRLDTLSLCGGIPDLATRGAEDGVGALYSAAAQEGGLLVDSNRRQPNPLILLRAAAQEWGPPRLVVADRWRKAELEDLARHFRWPWHLAHSGQSGEGSEIVARTRKAAVDGPLSVVPRRLLDFALENARVRQNYMGDWILDFKKDWGAQDDPAAAMALAICYGRKMVAERRSQGRPMMVPV